MFGKRLTLFKLLGFEVRVDLSWLILAFLVAWSLAQGLFPVIYPDASPQAYWSMGIAGVLGLVVSIVIHEFSHSLVARRYGLPIHGITLFIFGGVAEMTDEPPNAKSEFLMAVAGPLASVVLAILFWQLYSLAAALAWPEAFQVVIAYLAYINLILAIFNVIPAFPLDGGRMLRAALWGWRKDIRWATRWAAGIGGGFGLVLVFLGLLQILQGYLIGGMWLILIGLFLRGAANAGYRQLIMRENLGGEPVRRFMSAQLVTVEPTISVQELVEDYVYKYHHKMFPVVENDRLVGCVSTGALKKIPRTEWDRHSVREFSETCSKENTVTPETDAGVALNLMSSTGESRLLVVDEGRLQGIVTLRDLLKFISLKQELE